MACLSFVSQRTPLKFPKVKSRTSLLIEDAQLVIDIVGIASRPVSHRERNSMSSRSGISIVALVFYLVFRDKTFDLSAANNSFRLEPDSSR